MAGLALSGDLCMLRKLWDFSENYLRSSPPSCFLMRTEKEGEDSLFQLDSYVRVF